MKTENFHKTPPSFTYPANILFTVLNEKKINWVTIENFELAKERKYLKMYLSFVAHPTIRINGWGFTS